MQITLLLVVLLLLIRVHVSFQISVFIFFQYIYPERELPDHMVVSVFNFWMNSYSDFHIACTSLHSNYDIVIIIIQSRIDHLCQCIFRSIYLLINAANVY